MLNCTCMRHAWNPNCPRHGGVQLNLFRPEDNKEQTSTAPNKDQLTLADYFPNWWV